MTIDEEIDNK